MSPTSASELMAPIQQAMEATDRELSVLLADESEAIEALTRHISRYAGKRLRPALLHLFAGAVGTPTDEHPRIGALVEALHMASLLHDDVLDDADLRRGIATLNALHDNQVPILLGDWIYARAYSAALELSTLVAARELARASRAVILGEIEQTFFRYRTTFDEARYFAIVRDKTAALYEAAARLGAHYAGGDAQVCAEAALFGRELGMAFQIIDDCLDVTGEEAVVGKSLGTDLETGKITLPVIRLAQGLDGARRERFVSLLRDELDGSRRRALQAEFDFEPVVAGCRAEARALVERSLGRLARLQDGAHKRGLLGVADFVLARSY